jgi:hypothetical protein
MSPLIGTITGVKFAEAKIGRAEESVKRLIDDAPKRAEVIKKKPFLRLGECTNCVANLTRNQEKDVTKSQKPKEISTKEDHWKKDRKCESERGAAGIENRKIYPS